MCKSKAEEIFERHFGKSINDFSINDSFKELILKSVEQYLPFNMEDVQKLVYANIAKGLISINLVECLDNEISYELAESLIFIQDSFNKPELLCKLFDVIAKDDWLKLFRQFWVSCDSCSLYHNQFIEILNQYSLDYIRENTHDDDDKLFYDSLPEEFTVYRGTFIDDRFKCGISWTVDKAVAEKFKKGYQSFKDGGLMMMRYRCNTSNDKFDLLKDIAKSGVELLEMKVKKTDIFVNTSRGESEIFVLKINEI